MKVSSAKFFEVYATISPLSSRNVSTAVCLMLRPRSCNSMMRYHETVTDRCEVHTHNLQEDTSATGQHNVVLGRRRRIQPLLFMKSKGIRETMMSNPYLGGLVPSINISFTRNGLILNVQKSGVEVAKIISIRAELKQARTLHKEVQ